MPTYDAVSIEAQLVLQGVPRTGWLQGVLSCGERAEPGCLHVGLSWHVCSWTGNEVGGADNHRNGCPAARVVSPLSVQGDLGSA